MNSNELTFNELSAFDFIPNNWGTIDVSNYTAYTDDDEVCFKLKVWLLQCKFATLTQTYINHILYGIVSPCSLIELKDFKRGLEVLNDYDPRDIALNTITHNILPYSTILNIMQVLYNKY